MLEMTASDVTALAEDARMKMLKVYEELSAENRLRMAHKRKINVE